jgi:hypothetical protein
VIEELTLNKADHDAIVDLISENLTIEKGAHVSISSTKLKKIEDSYYLVSYHENSVTTTLLKVENKSTLKYNKISCTSELSSNKEVGCIPHKDGNKCIASTKGDCTKTVTSGVLKK